MKTEAGPVYDPEVGATRRVCQERCRYKGDKAKCSFGQERLPANCYLSFRATFIFVTFFVYQTLAKLAVAVAVHSRFIPVHAKIPGNILPVCVKIHADHCLAERL